MLSEIVVIRRSRKMTFDDEEKELINTFGSPGVRHDVTGSFEFEKRLGRIDMCLVNDVGLWGGRGKL